jgi:ATPase subunit of ABC transporter with duplicated ATPase domains
VELLRQCVDTLWHIEGGRIHIFSGHYDDYLREKKRERTSLEHELAELHRQKKDMHTALMQEQKRAAKSRSKGEKSIRERKWPTVVSDAKARRGEETSGHKQLAIHHRKEELSERLSSLHLAEIIRPTFSLCASDIGHQTLISITDGSVGYADPPLLSNIHLSMMNSDRMALLGENGSGKSTLIKSILNDPALTRSGHWHTPKREDIGYLDQHYGTLSPEQSVLETIHTLVPAWSHQEVRRHLNDFLFRKNEEVNASVSTLSGGEKARLSLAQIAARTPKLLILDELTNNLDLETRAHVIQVLQAYPGTLIVISHDPDFLKAIGIQNAYLINDGTLRTTAFS